MNQTEQNWQNVLVVIHDVNDAEWKIITQLQNEIPSVRVIVDDNIEGAEWQFPRYDAILFGSNVTDINQLNIINEILPNSDLNTIMSLTQYKTLCNLPDQVQPTTEIVLENERLKKQMELLEGQNKDLKKSNEKLTSFAHVISHDLKGPLRTINSFGQLLESRNANALDDRSLEFIKLMRNNAKTMSKLIDDILTNAKMNVSQEALMLKPIDLNKVVENVTLMLSDKIRETNATITIGDLPVINGIESEFLQLFQNFVCNALKFSSPERPLELHISSFTQHAGEYIISIKDNGIGIAEDEQAKVFEKHYKSQNSNSAGTGLGLYTCQKIVEAYAGRIDVKSKLDEGTTFMFNLQQSRTDKDL